MHIETDDLARPEVLALLREHLAHMHEMSPPESVHALDVSKLRSPDITFWTVWEDDTLLGCGAFRELDATQGEVKSMRTPNVLRRKGAGRAVLAHIIDVAKQRGYTRLNLETGSAEGFKPALRLYEGMGFVRSGPFGEYRDDGFKVFMTLPLA